MAKLSRTVVHLSSSMIYSFQVHANVMLRYGPGPTHIVAAVMLPQHLEMLSWKHKTLRCIYYLVIKPTIENKVTWIIIFKICVIKQIDRC